MRGAIVTVLVGVASAPAARADPSRIPERTALIIGNVEATVAARGIERRPTSVAPDVYMRVVHEITVGVVHSHRALGLVGGGGGLCVSDCDERYRNLGVDAVYNVRPELGARVRLVARALDPLKLQLQVGATWRWQRGRVAIGSEPYLSAGLNNRDVGNTDFVNVPAWLAVRAGAGLSASLQTGVLGPLSRFGDNYEIPLALGASYRRGAYAVGTDYAFARILGRLNAAVPRHVVVWIAWQR